MALAKLLLKPANLLVMDEPTNHLDLDSSEALIEALEGYTGTLMFVSHNRSFLDALATQVWDVRDRKVVPYPGNLAEYLAHLDGEGPARARGEETGGEGRRQGAAPRRIASGSRRKPGRRAASAPAPLKKEIAKLEARIAELEAAQKAREAQLVDPAFAADFAKSRPVLDAHREAGARTRRGDGPVGSGEQRAGGTRELTPMNRSTWYHAGSAEFLELRVEGNAIHERSFDLRHHPGEFDSSTVLEVADTQAAANGMRIREDHLVEGGWVRRIETDFARLFEALAQHEPFRTWAQISRGAVPLQRAFSWMRSVSFAEPLPRFTRCGFDESHPGGCLELRAEWDSPELVVKVGPPAPQRLLSLLPQALVPVFSAHSYLSLFALDDPEYADLELALPALTLNGWFLRVGETSWRFEDGRLLRRFMSEPVEEEPRSLESVLFEGVSQSLHGTRP